MDDYSKLSASDGTGEAVIANIENNRIIGATTLDVDNVENWPANFIFVTGTLNPNNYIDNASMTIMYGHLDAGNIAIDGYADGYTDVGNTAGQIAIIKPTTEWVNQMATLAQVVHKTDGTLKDDIITLRPIADGTINSLRSTNLLYNGNMNVWQRNTTATPNDDVYSGADRWNFLAEANASWTVARDTDAPVGSQYSMKCSNVTANNQMAIVQFLENLDTKQLDDGVVSLSFWAKTTGTEIGNLRAAILTWGSTADSLTSDVIGTWAQNGTNPTWATNWTMENTPANLALTASWQRFTIENVAIDSATVNNLAVIVWVDDGTITSGDDFWISQIQLNYGSEAAPFQHRSYAEELALCQRYYVKVWNGMGYTGHEAAFVGSNQTWSKVHTPVPLRTTPTMTSTSLITRYGGTDYTWTSPSVHALDPNGVSITGTTTGTTNGNSGTLTSNSGTLAFDAEL